jgi:Domain of unknown function DUF11
VLEEFCSRLTYANVGVTVALVLAGTGLTVGASSAGAAVTIGASSTATATCTHPIVELQVSSASTASYVVPDGGGVITSWHVGDGGSGGVKLKLFAPTADPKTFVVAGQSAVEMQSGTGANVYGTRIPVRGGEHLGLLSVSGTTGCLFSTSAGADAVVQDFPAPDTPNGSSEFFAFAPFGPYRVNVTATIEADADGDGFGDETQDACPGIPGGGSGCLKADLAITKTARQSSERGLVTYTLIAANNGPDQAGGVSVVDTLPSGATVVSANGPAGPCTLGAGSVGCPAGTLASGATATFTIVARLQAGRQTNSASISSPAVDQAAAFASDAGDTNPSNNTSSATVDVLPSATVDVIPPSILSAQASPSTFRLGSLLPRFTRKRPVGTTISFTLSEPARAALIFSQTRPGRRIGKRCVAPKRNNQRKRRCPRSVRVGSLTFSGHAGTNKVRFQGRLSRSKKLTPGRYTLTITATDSAGNAARPKTTKFTIVRG